MKIDFWRLLFLELAVGELGGRVSATKSIYIYSMYVLEGEEGD